MSESRTIARSRSKGLKDFYIALVTKNEANEYVADTPHKLARAISAKVQDNFSTAQEYSDDVVEYTDAQYVDTDIEIEINALSAQDLAIIFGHKYENGSLIRGKDDQPPTLALGFREKLRNGKYNFVWYFAGTFNQGLERDYQTQTNESTTQTRKLKAKFTERMKDGMYAHEVDETNLLTTETSAKEALENWFSEVQEPVSSPTV